jgi:hypothetical protein
MKTHVTINGNEISFAGRSDDGKGNISSRGAESVVNDILLALDGISFEKKEEQKPFSVDNPPLNGSEYWYIENDAKNGMHPTLAEFYKDVLFSVKMLSQGNCFRTKEEAEAALSRMLQALKS